MKSSWLTPIVSLALGFGVASLIFLPGSKPAAPEPPADRKAPREGSRPLIIPIRGSSPAEEGEKAPSAEVRRRFESAFKNVSNRADRARIFRIAEALGLDEKQHASFEGLLAGRRADFAEASTDPDTAPDRIAAMEEAFETAVLELLDDRQIEALGHFRERALWNETAALAHRDMAELTAQIDLSEEQHDKAFEAFRRSRAASISGGRSSILGEAFETLAAGSFAVADPALEEVFRNPVPGEDPGDFQRRYAEAQRRINEAKVELLTPILTPAQLTQYHAMLESYVAMIGAPEAREPQSPPGPAPEEESR